MWQVTLELTVEEAETYTGPTDYRTHMMHNESLFGGAKVAAVQRADASSGAPLRYVGSDRESNNPT